MNNGVYRSGIATSQEAYHDAVSGVFATLDDLEQRLAGRRYLLGDAVTEADVRLWVTLARFNPVYRYHFKVNLRRLTDYPNLWGYARDLYSLPAFRAQRTSTTSSGTTTPRIRTSTRPESSRTARCWTGPRRITAPCPDPGR